MSFINRTMSGDDPLSKCSSGRKGRKEEKSGKGEKEGKRGEKGENVGNEGKQIIQSEFYQQDHVWR